MNRPHCTPKVPNMGITDYFPMWEEPAWHLFSRNTSVIAGCVVLGMLATAADSRRLHATTG